MQDDKHDRNINDTLRAAQQEIDYTPREYSTRDHIRIISKILFVALSISAVFFLYKLI